MLYNFIKLLRRLNIALTIDESNSCQWKGGRITFSTSANTLLTRTVTVRKDKLRSTNEGMSNSALFLSFVIIV